MSIEVMKQALEALGTCEEYEWTTDEDYGMLKTYDEKKVHAAITALRTAIAEAEKQEPVAWLGLEPSDMPDGDDPMYDHDFFIKGMVWADAMLCKKNAIPPAAQRQPLTDEAIWRQYQALWPFHPAEEPRLAKDIVKFARAVEAAHGIKEKNT
jgi:hypothetical protein